MRRLRKTGAVDQDGNIVTIPRLPSISNEPPPLDTHGRGATTPSGAAARSTLTNFNSQTGGTAAVNATTGATIQVNELAYFNAGIRGGGQPRAAGLPAPHRRISACLAMAMEAPSRGFGTCLARLLPPSGTLALPGRRPRHCRLRRRDRRRSDVCRRAWSLFRPSPAVLAAQEAISSMK